MIGKSITYLTTLEQGRLGNKVDNGLLGRKDVIGDMCRAIQSLDDKLSDIIRQLQAECNVLTESSAVCLSSADGVMSSMSQITATVQEVAAATTTQAEESNDVSTNISQMGDIYCCRLINDPEQYMLQIVYFCAAGRLIL